MEFVPRKASVTHVAEPQANERVEEEETEPEIILKDSKLLASSAEIELPDQTSIEFPPDDSADAAQRAAEAAEAERLRREWDQKQLEIADKARKLRKLHEASAKKQQNKRLSPAEAEEEAAERRKKIRNYIIISVGGLFMAYWLYTVVMAILPGSKNLAPQFTAEKFIAEYAKDKKRAEEKYAMTGISLKGKMVVEPSPDPNARARFFFAPGGAGDLKIEFILRDTDLAENLRENEEFLMTGVVQRMKDQKLIVVSNAAPIRGR